MNLIQLKLIYKIDIFKSYKDYFFKIYNLYPLKTNSSSSILSYRIMQPKFNNNNLTLNI